MSSGKLLFYRLAVLTFLSFFISSCYQGIRIRLPKDYSCVYSLNRKLTGFLPDPNTNKFILYASKGALLARLPELKKSSVDSLMFSSPDWQMIIYYKGPLSDTSEVTSIMIGACCSAPVVFNEEDQFMAVNNFEKSWGSISYFLDKNNRVIGGWLVGGSPFEKQFNVIKRRIR